MLINYYYICEPGVETVAIYAAKDMVTVKGTMDVKELVPFLANSSNEPSTFSSGQIDDSATPLALKKKKEVPAPEAKEGKIEVKFERRKQRVARRKKKFLTAEKIENERCWRWRREEERSRTR